MSDERDFHINITGDASGIVDASRKSAGALNGVAEAQEQAGEQASKHSGHIKGLNKIFHALNEVVPGLGLVMEAAFSPVAAAIGMAVMALKVFHEKMKEFDEECRKAAEEAAKPLTNRLEQQRETVVRTAEGMERMRGRLEDAARGQDGMKDATERAIVSLKAQQAAAESLNDAVKENELASLEARHAAGIISEEQYANQRLEIEQKFLERKRELALREEMTEILIKKRLIEQAEMKQPELKAAEEAAEKSKEKALEDLGSYDKAGIEERYKETKKKLIEFEAKYSGSGLAALKGDGPFASQFAEDAHNEYVKLVAAKDLAEKAWKQSPGEEARLKVAAERASHEAERRAKESVENQRYITDTGRDVGERRMQYDARSQSNSDLTRIERDTLRQRENAAAMSSPEGKMVQEVSATETALAHGRRISGGEQSQAIAFAQLLRTLGVGNEATVTGLASVHETQAQHNLRLLALVERIKLAEARQRDVYNQ